MPKTRGSQTFCGESACARRRHTNPDDLDFKKCAVDWKLADAKNKFSEVVNRALNEEPQRILRRDDAVVVVAEEQGERLAGGRPDFKDLLLNGPGVDGADLDRDKSPMRNVEL